MTFNEKDKLKALAIVHVFETSKPFGDYAACVVLNDGAGVSYGINQFTHRSGSLAAVVREYLAGGGQVGREILTAALPVLAKKSVGAIEKLAANATFKRALKAAAATSEMRSAQQKVCFEKYLSPAIQICTRMRFVLPLSLAVVYDSVTHGSWEWISARVTGTVRTTTRRTDELAFERSWITEYVRTRHRWLTEIRRLKVTNYRTRFFLDQIAIGNWELRLPITVHGLRMTTVEPPVGLAIRDLDVNESDAEETGFPAMAESQPEAGLALTNEIATIPENTEQHAAASDPQVGDAAISVTSIIEKTGDTASAAAAKFDRVDGVVTAVSSRKDAAKSLWTTIVGTFWQAAWGVIGFFAGLPRIVWIVVAIVAATLTLFYLYRQITLGRIREMRP